MLLVGRRMCEVAGFFDILMATLRVAEDCRNDMTKLNDLGSCDKTDILAAESKFLEAQRDESV